MLLRPKPTCKVYGVAFYSFERVNPFEIFHAWITRVGGKGSVMLSLPNRLPAGWPDLWLKHESRLYAGAQTWFPQDCLWDDATEAEFAVQCLNRLFMETR